MSVTTSNIGLVQWTGVNDSFNHTQLATNFGNIDAHDHTGGPTKGLQVPTSGLTNLSVSAAKLASNSIITDKILDGNVTTGKIAFQAITASKMGILPRTRVYHNIAQTIATGALTALLFNTERFDTDNMHGGVNPGRIVCKTAGTYMIGASIQWGVNATGTRQVGLRVNGTTIIGSNRFSAFAIDDVHQSVSVIYALAVNDYVEVVARQTSGIGLDVSAASQYSPEFYAAFLSN
jgi:hypothetical protein